MDNERCKNCRFSFLRPSLAGLVECRRFPQAVPNQGSHWCGEWKPIEVQGVTPVMTVNGVLYRRQLIFAKHEPLTPGRATLLQDLFHDVLQAIADGAPNGRELAKAALGWKEER